MQRIALGRGVRLQQPAACLTAANLDKRRALGCADVARKLAAGSKRAALGGLGHIRRAAGDGLLARPEEGKILIVLSDGRPNDIIVNRPNSHNPQPYYGEYAVKDTAYEIRKLRSQGVYVLGVFAGREKDLAAEKKIFGRDFAYIRDIQNFSRVTGRYLRRLLEEL